MHERSLVQALLKQVETLQARHQASRVTSVRVCVGKFSGVEPELFRLAFEDMAGNSSLGEARLEMDCVDVRVRCDACGGEFDAASFRFVCPTCGSRETTVVRGEELTLEAITIEEDRT
jgi:hydrogenase nickel incorporation protein HypA/HybF